MTLEKKLRQFFMKYDPGRLRLSKKIAREFRGKDDAVMKHLTRVYANGGPGEMDEAAIEAMKERKRLKREEKERRRAEALAAVQTDEGIVEDVENAVVAEQVVPDEEVMDEIKTEPEVPEIVDEVAGEETIEEEEEDNNRDQVESFIDDLDD